MESMETHAPSMKCHREVIMVATTCVQKDKNWISNKLHDHYLLLSATVLHIPVLAGDN